MTGSFRHEAMFYAGPGEFLAGTAPFVREGVAAGEAVLVAVPRERARLLEDALGADAASVRFADMEELGRNPARIIPAWQDFVDAHGGPDAPVRGIGEPIWAQRSEAELLECQHHESLLNLAFEGAPAFELMCPYDTAALAPAVVAAARRSHPGFVEGGCRRASGEYVPPDHAPSPFSGQLAPMPADAAALRFGARDLGAVRAFATLHARGARLARDRTADLVLAVDELAGNAVRHGGGEGTVHVWRDDGALVCQVDDAGRRIERALVGRVRPTAQELSGRGLWIVNQLCDLVEIRSRRDGTSVRVRVAVGAGAYHRAPCHPRPPWSSASARR